MGSTKNSSGRLLPFEDFPELRTVMEDQRRVTDRLAGQGIICP